MACIPNRSIGHFIVNMVNIDVATPKTQRQWSVNRAQTGSQYIWALHLVYSKA